MISKIENRLKENKFLLNAIMKLATGSLMAQIIMVVVSPISTRLFTPQELGVYTLVLTAVSMFGPVLSLRYDIAIVLGKDKRETYALVKISLVISIAMSLIIGSGYVYYLKDNIDVQGEIGNFVYALIPILCITGLTNILTAYNNKNQEYGIIGSVQVIRAVVQNGIMILAGILQLGSIGLIISQLIGNCAGISKQSKKIIKEIKIIWKVEVDTLKKALIDYRQQIYFSTPAIFVNAASYSLINFVVSDLYGMDTFGYYSLSYRMLGIPLSLVVVNVSKVFFEQAVKDRSEKGSYRDMFIKVLILLIPISITMAGAIYLLGPSIFEIVFGEGWGIAGEYARILVPMFSIKLIVSTLSPSFTISSKQNIELPLQVLFFIVLLLGYIGGKKYNFSIENFLTTISIGYSFVYIVFLAYMIKLSSEKVEITKTT
ncbi:lipopolysaccharide biosynthesis protein [Turicibacter sanguinis]|uniref:lipopolysaccharide biosynthesis protein n=2 Tax=Turicibacter sanguinis TaxID=154288 RepID=UPI0006C6149B|nr:oligosaccharide flippase family protein [Turicibacter sanguinis]MDB8576363.1 oligosaccharide flippase family protein [Turicibacter sanguinis]MDB8579307.1 oligosaccharide flippase family protein [Turicibacter sanguinis]MDB8585054.1 oligosaccharide flippase family protein [Turicibacter sanguinis]MDB8588079.1 oligosaccharide flippase family protein [Turicibacter sanguinis]MDB8598809.1 oligosaccharide flippase family protein [Turicibacter sanguinis]